jgi:hypothetical protein
VLLTELVVTIEATLVVLQDYAASARYVAIIVNRGSFLTSDLLPKRALIALKNRQSTGSLRSAVHLEGDFNIVTRLEGTKVVCQLLGICVLLEERCGSNLLLTSSVTLSYGAATSVGTRNILAADLVSIDKSVDYVTCAKLDGCITMGVAVVQRGDRKEKSIGLLSAETNCGYVALIGIHISTDVITGVVLLADEVVLLCKLYGQLSISREVNTELTFGVVGRYTNSVTKYVCQQQAVSIRMLAHIT